MSTTLQLADAVGYFRVSGPGQARERNVSLEVQEDAFLDHCRTHGLNPVRTFIDVASGRKDDRQQYRAMLEYVKQNGIGNVVVLFLDRFGRNPREILRRYWELEELGITVQSINEDLKEEMVLLIRAGMAGAESQRTGERVRMALLKAAAKGALVNKLPYGLTKLYDKRGKVEGVEQVPGEAAVIREAFDLAIGNHGYKAIADELNARGHRTKNGKPWATQTVKLMLTTPAVAGHFVFKGATETIEHRDVYPAILNATEWTQLQERLTIRREQVRGKSATSNYLLSGIARCGHCGGAMSGASAGPGRYKYYKCANRQMSRARCDEAVAHRREHLETSVLEFLGQYTDPAVVQELLDVQGQEADTRAVTELARVTARLGQLEQGFLNDLDRVDRGIMTEAEYLKRQELRRGEQERLQVRKVDLDAAIAAQRDMEAQVASVPVNVRSFLEEFRDMDVR